MFSLLGNVERGTRKRTGIRFAWLLREQWDIFIAKCRIDWQ